MITNLLRNGRWQHTPCIIFLLSTGLLANAADMILPSFPLNPVPSRLLIWGVGGGLLCPSLASAKSERARVPSPNEKKRNETKRNGGVMLALQRAPVVSLQLACLFLCVFARNHGKRPSVSVPADAAATKTDGKMKVCFYYVASTPAPVFVSSLFRGDVPRAVRFGSGKFKVRFFLKKNSS